MSHSANVTGWLDGLRIGDDDAAQNLWEEYFRRLVGLARKRLGELRRGPDDSEDIALSAFDTFCRGVAEGRFPKLNDRDDLWQILVMLTAHKAIDAIRREFAAKRDAGAKDAQELPSLENVIGREPTPSFAANIAEQCQRLLDVLNDDVQRKIALYKLEGYSNPEIAKKMDLSRATIERKLRLIRRAWKERDADG